MKKCTSGPLASVEERLMFNNCCDELDELERYSSHLDQLAGGSR